MVEGLCHLAKPTRSCPQGGASVKVGNMVQVLRRLAITLGITEQ